jgi:hypothetical protein
MSNCVSYVYQRRQQTVDEHQLVLRARPERPPLRPGTQLRIAPGLPNRAYLSHQI